ncbi:putative protoporphyrinogen oxidase [Rosellinia necatrix]|uniref:Protoporphyrinogen oxidase n=1 Tax=Rosellinia necatrix TaxID=77044 RepID=A0A1S7UJG9_ROSNE|nr:putative protoporphyrinogen oxidase [Rosellinia necatrix]
MPSPDPRSWALADMVRSYLTEPIWSGSVWAAFNFLAHYRGFFARHESQDQSGFPREAGKDESVAEFLTSILGDDEIVNNIVSAMMHGIYGGDINKLSAKHTMLETLWYRFQRPPPAAGRTWVDLDNLKVMYDMMHSPNRLKIIELAEGAINWKLLAFEDGLVSLVSGLEKDLKSRSNVTFKYGEPVTSLKHEKHKILVTTPGTERPIKYDHVISTLFSKQLARIAEPKNSLPSLEKTHAVTIMVVNLWYPNPNLLAQGGFGYLIPSTALNNHEGALGVLFDSELRTNDSEIPGTKLTVMLGGHHWDGWKYFPSEEVGIAMAKEVVKRQLGISDTENVVARARLCPNCLPQHFVGHRERMRDAHYEIMSAFQGHLTVAGPSYTSVGVIPAMRAGFDAGMRVARGHAQPWFPFTTSIDSEQSLNYDYWGGAKEGEVPDLLGASGLLRFTANEWDSVRPVSRSELLFRTFTAKDLRFRDEFGNFLDVDRRMLKNAPPGVWNGHKNQHAKSTESGD